MGCLVDCVFGEIEKLVGTHTEHQHPMANAFSPINGHLKLNAFINVFRNLLFCNTFLLLAADQSVIAVSFFFGSLL